jgi:ribosomal protein L12E/L44/L45/RPP1/RPP2
MNAGASEWKPSVGASEWSPNNNASDSWEDEPIAPVVAPTPAAAPAAAPAADEGDDGLYMELQQLLADGEITEHDFVEALLESGLPVDPAMQERVNKTNAVKKAIEQAVAAAATATSAVAVATSAPTNPASTTTTTKGTEGTEGKGETKTATKAEKAAAKRGGDNK